MTMDTSNGEGHHVTVVGPVANTSSAVSTTIHGDARSPMGVASTTVADGSTLSTLQQSSSHDAQSSLERFYEPLLKVSHSLLVLSRMPLIFALAFSACLLPSASPCVTRALLAPPCFCFACVLPLPYISS